MLESIISKLEQLEKKKESVKPKIEDINIEREKRIADVNKNYDKMVDNVSKEVISFENGIMNELIDSFIHIIMEEFDAKRSMGEYRVTAKFKEFKTEVGKIDFFPQELVERMEKVINGTPIENIAYDLEKIEKSYKK